MGYNLTIGEFTSETHPEDRYVWVGAERAESPEAPLDSSCEEGSRENSISPSYTAWSEFCKLVGLSDVFYSPSRDGYVVRSEWHDRHTPLLDQHPGAVALTKAHLDRFRAAQRGYTALCSGDVDYNKRRIDWLVWWTEWALKNCKYPTFANS